MPTVNATYHAYITVKSGNNQQTVKIVAHDRNKVFSEALDLFEAMMILRKIDALEPTTVVIMLEHE